MTLRKIALLGHPILRQQARALTREELLSAPLQAFIDDMIETMRDAHGAGIAANQVYEAVQICVIEVKNNPRYPYKPNIPLTVLVNPVITVLSTESFQVYEGCLSVPNLRGQVSRYAHIRVSAWDRFGKDVAFEVSGLSAGTYQHELDHLQGKLFVDHIQDMSTLCTLDNFERFVKENFVKHAYSIVEKYGS